MFAPVRFLLAAALLVLTKSHPLPDAKIFFPGEDPELDARGGTPMGYVHRPETDQRSHHFPHHESPERGRDQYSGSHPPVLSGSAPLFHSTPDGRFPSGFPHGGTYGSSHHQVSYSSYGSHSPGPNRLTYSSHSGTYGSGGMNRHPMEQAYSNGHFPAHSHTGSYGSTHNHNAAESIGQREQSSNHEGDWASHSTGGAREVRVENSGSSFPDAGQHGSEDSLLQHVQPERHVVSEVTHEHTAEPRRPSHNLDTVGSIRQHEAEVYSAQADHNSEQNNIERQAVETRPNNTAAAEHHIIEEIKELTGITSSPPGSTKDPIAQQQQIIREIKDLAEPSLQLVTNNEDDTRQVFEVDRPTDNNPGRADSEARKTEGVQSALTREEAFESPLLKETSGHGALGAGHGTHIQTEIREESSHSRSPKPTPDPLDLSNIYDAYLRGDFKPGSPKANPPQPAKELDPEVKKAIDNIMRDWEVLPEREGKPVPPPRNYKITKHVKVTQTTHNRPVVQPSQTVTKVTRTETVHPSSSTQRKVIRHHINIAELLEQLRQLESSNQHRNITWCEEKIKEFLTELNRKEESGIEINQSVQEETLHHILSQDQTITQDHTITKEVHHQIEHDASGGVVEEPFVKKTVGELGLNEPTRPPSHWTHEHTRHETHTVIDGQPGPGENGESSVRETVEESQKVDEPTETHHEQVHQVHESGAALENSENEEEQHIFTNAPNQDHVKPLESLSHQAHVHTSSEAIVPQENEQIPGEIPETEPENEGGLEIHESEHADVTVPPQLPERPVQTDMDEFKGETEVHHRPLPPNYKPREESEEREDVDEVSHQESRHEVTENEETNEGQENSIPDYVPQNEDTHSEDTEEGHHDRIDEFDVDLPAYNSTDIEHSSHESIDQDEMKTEVEKAQDSAGGDSLVDTKVIHSHEAETQNTGGLYGGEYEVVNQGEHQEGGASGGSSSHHEHGHSGGGTNTQYTVETEEHHTSGGGDNVQTEINYDQLIEELVSLETLPGHQAIDKCEEKIRQFLEVLKRQQERGFDQNQLELERLRHLIEEMQAHKHNQQISATTEAPASFWRKISKKIKTTLQKAKTKAHHTVNGILNTE